jgi:hypothetical protein
METVVFFLAVLWAISGVAAVVSANKLYLWRIAIWLGPLTFLLLKDWSQPHTGDPAWKPLQPLLPDPPDGRPEWTAPQIPPPKKAPEQRDANRDLLVGCCVTLGALACLSLAAIVVGSSLRTERAQPAHIAPPTPHLSRFWWSIGDSPATVMAIQGRPELITNDGAMWRYNLSDRVTFDVGSKHVIHWRNSTGKLRVTIGPRNQQPERYPGNSFKEGSTMDDVLLSEGMPMQVAWNPTNDSQDWTYSGSHPSPISTVFFDRGIVRNWAYRPEARQSSKKSETVSAVSPTEKSQTPPSSPYVDPHLADQPMVQRQAPQWRDFQGQRSVAVVSVRPGGVVSVNTGAASGARLSKSARLPVFRRDPYREYPKYVGELVDVSQAGNAITGRAEGFTAAVGDYVIIPNGLQH